MLRAAILVAIAASIVLTACSDSSTEPTAEPPTPASDPAQTAMPPPTPTLPPRPTPTMVSPTATPSPSPTPIPAPVAVRATPLEIPEVGQIIQVLGYALVPGYVPEGFQPAQALVSGGRAVIVYGGPEGALVFAYPVIFSSEGELVQGDPDSPTRPDDADSVVNVAGATGRLVRGQWSEATVMRGPAIDPDDAEWNYEVTLTLFFDILLPSGDTVPVWLQAQDNPGEWIAEDELVWIAESLSPVE